MTDRIEQLSSEDRKELEKIIPEMQRSNEMTDAGWKAAICALLAKRGFHLKTRYMVAHRGDGYRGHVSIVAAKGTLTLAIEFGNHRVKRNAPTKLRQVGEKTIRLIGLRSSEFNGPAPGVDHVFSRIASGVDTN